MKFHNPTDRLQLWVPPPLQVYAVTVRTRTNQTSWAIMHFARPLSVEHALKFEFAIGAKSMKFRGINEEQAMISTGAFATVWSLQKEKVAVARMESIYSTANNADHLEGQYKSNPGNNGNPQIPAHYLHLSTFALMIWAH